jgi:hypothetical protein
MQKTEYMVYWTQKDHHCGETCSTLGRALSTCEELRRMRQEGLDIRFITMVCENVDMVGQAGVDEVKHGATPDGIEYTWQKRRGGGQ